MIRRWKWNKIRPLYNVDTTSVPDVETKFKQRQNNVAQRWYNVDIKFFQPSVDVS